MFEVGDKVRVFMPTDQIHGLEGVVTKVEPEKMWPVVITLDYFGAPRFDWPFNEDELEKIDD